MTGPTTFKAVKDNAVSTTTTNYGSTGVTSTTVATSDGAKFPSAFPFRLDIWTGVAGSDPTADTNWEQVTVTARAGDVLTHSATTKTHSASPQINVMLPQDAADVSDTQTAVNNLEGGNLPFNAVSTSSTLPTTGVEYGLSGNITATLPVVSAGKYYMLKKTDTAANTVTLQGSGGALIEGASTYLMTYQNQSVFLVFDGTNWQVMATQVPGVFGLVQGEVPGGTPNGSLTAFTTASLFQTNSLRVYRNGQRLKGGGVDYTEAAGTQGFTMVSAPLTGDNLLVDYNIYNATFMQGSNSTITNEQPTGTLNGSNASFICARAYITGTLEVMLDGRTLKRGTDYTETTPGSGIFTMTVAPQSTQEVLVNYQFNLNPSSNADTTDGVHASPTGFAEAGQLIADYGGWSLFAGTFTFNAAGAMNTPTDLSGLISIGDRIRYKQGGGFKYGVVTAISSTVMTLTGGSDYTVANSAITNVFYSKQATPFGYPQWFSYTPTITGFSANPTVLARFSVTGRTCTTVMRTTANGTSNATTFTVTAPIAAGNFNASYFTQGPAFNTDSGAAQAAGDAYINGNGSSTINIEKTVSASAWTATGAKSSHFTLVYEI